MPSTIQSQLQLLLYFELALDKYIFVSVLLRCGPEPHISTEGERELSQWIKDRFNYGVPVNKQEIINAAWKLSTKFVKSKGFGPNGPSNQWYVNFMNRNPGYCKRVADNISCATARVTAKGVEEWFNKVMQSLQKSNLTHVLSDPRRIINADETGFVLDPKRGYVIAPKGSKRVHNITDGDKSQMTAMLTISADGYLFTPFLIYPGVRLHGSITKAIADQHTRINYTTTESGWETTVSMLDYINSLDEEIIERGIEKPVLLFVDGHASHDNYEVCELVTISLRQVNFPNFSFVSCFLLSFILGVQSLQRSRHRVDTVIS